MSPPYLARVRRLYTRIGGLDHGVCRPVPIVGRAVRIAKSEVRFEALVPDCGRRRPFCCCLLGRDGSHHNGCTRCDDRDTNHCDKFAANHDAASCHHDDNHNGAGDQVAGFGGDRGSGVLEHVDGRSGI